MSRRPLRRPAVLALFALGPVALGSCERGTPGPADPLAPEATVVSDGGEGRFTLIEGRIPVDVEDLSVSKLIGAAGGTLSLAGHTLTVPAGAVTAPTLFVMTLPTTGFVEVELSATRVDLLGGVVDVGARGFGDAEVTLTLSYAWASNVTDPSRLRILYMEEGDHSGRHVPLPSVVDPERRTVTTRLEHFSAYCMATD